MLRIKAKYIYFIIFTALFFQMHNASFAGYDIVKAKTVANENIKSENSVDTQYVPTYNDPELPDFTPEESIGVKASNKIKNFIAKKRKKNNKVDELQEEDKNEENIISQNESFEENEDVNDKNRFQINADKVYYDDEDGNVYAKGNVKIIAKSQGVVLKADDAVLDKTTQTLKLHNDVKIIKDGAEMSGEYMLVDLNEENILMDNPLLEAYSFKINAQEGYLIANDIQMLNGVVKSAKDTEYPLVTNGFMRIEPLGADYLKENILNNAGLEQKKQSYRIKAKEIVLTSYKDHNSLKLNGSSVYYNNHKIVHNSDIEIISDKSNQTVETNMPEIGTLRSFGTYIGYGLVFRLPKGQSFKFMPALTYGDNNIGVGAIGRYRSKNGFLEGGWNTSTTNVVARGRYKFTDNISLTYGRNSYLPEGFMGARRSGYAAQLQYLKSYYVSDLNANFNHGVYAGIFSDYQKHDQENAYTTTRFRYLAELSKPLLTYKNPEQDLLLQLGGLAQGSATVYGSGETMGVARIGPTVLSKLKFWESQLAYMISGVHGDTPFDFDQYRYGKSTIMLNEKFNINNKFAFGYRAFISPLRDNPEDHLLTESRLYAIAGPQDLKVVLSYDFVREVAHIDFMFLIGSDNSKIEFDKLSTKGMDGGEEKRDFYKSAKPVKILPQKENI